MKWIYVLYTYSTYIDCVQTIRCVIQDPSEKLDLNRSFEMEVIDLIQLIRLKVEIRGRDPVDGCVGLCVCAVG